MDPSAVEGLTDEEQPPGSCQMEGAVESGNIQFGNLESIAIK